MMNWKGFGKKRLWLNRVVFWHLPGMIDETAKNLSQDNWCCG
jgi:hypothetical protein